MDARSGCGDPALFAGARGACSVGCSSSRDPRGQFLDLPAVSRSIARDTGSIVAPGSMP